MYRLIEVDGANAAEVLRSQNEIAFAKYPLTDDHLELGYWWIVKTLSGTLCGFCGMVPCDPFPGVFYLKRSYIFPDHRGHGLQIKMIQEREAKARELGWHLLVSETTSKYAARNFDRAGFERVEPEQKWGEPNSIYFAKRLA